MIVPRFWAEARRQEKVQGKQFTVRRFGWSDVSEVEAQQHAAARVDEAWIDVVSGKEPTRRELKASYNGSTGVPIREEIVAVHGDSVITRNSYGAKCLNTPDVFFADIDFPKPPQRSGCGSLFLALAAAGVLRTQGIAWQLALTVGVGIYLVLLIVNRLRIRLHPAPEPIARKRIFDFVEKNPEWHLRIYRTPAGLRVLAMHRTFEPTEPAVAACFDALHTDGIYQMMCQNQRCFRARLTAKPWRAGVETHLRPRPGVWPLKPERIPERRRWLEVYDQAASSFAACRFIEAVGSQTVDPKAEAVRLLHDEECGAHSARPLA